MNKFMPIVALIALAFPASAIEVTTTPGQLSALVSDCSVTELTITGEMDARDFVFIADSLNALASLDLSGVNIVAYCDPQHPLTASVYDFPAGTLPQSILMGRPLQQIVLPDSLQAIGTAALAGCDRLTALEIPATVTTIGEYALSGSALQSIVVPAGVQTIGKGAFAHCFALQSAVVQAAYVGDFAFLGDEALQSLQLGEQVKQIGVEAFHGTGLLAFDATAAAQLEQLGAWAVASTPVTTVSMPAQLAQMGEGAFFATNQLSGVSLPEALTQVPDYAFAGGNQVTADSLLHEGITSVGDYAFYNWNAPQHFFLPSTLTYLGTRAMAGMTGLQQIDVAATVVPALGDSVWAGLDQPAVKLGTPNNNTAELYAAAEQWQDFYILHDYLLGDVNGDGVVDVADVNLIINYILGGQPSPFIFVAADIDANQTIDVGDLNAVINIILGNIETTTVRFINGHNTCPVTSDKVYIDEFSIAPGETLTLSLQLDNTQDYSAMQFDITLPSGLEMASDNVGATQRTQLHTQVMRTFEATSRVVSYSMQNANFSHHSGALLTLTVTATGEVAPDATIEIFNVVLAQADGKKFYAEESTTQVSNTSGVDNLMVDNSRAYVTGHTLVIEASEATTVQVVGVNGMMRTIDVPEGHSEWNDLGAGIYVIRLQGKSYKVVVQ